LVRPEKKLLWKREVYEYVGIWVGGGGGVALGEARE